MKHTTNPVRIILHYIGELRRNSNERASTQKVQEIRDNFSVDSTFDAIVIKHGTTVIKEFAPASTQKEILDTLETFRNTAAANIIYD